MRTPLQFLLRLALVALMSLSVANAAERATKDEAKALADKAAEHLGKVGIDKAIADFNDPAAGFIDRELFVNIIGPDHKLLSAYGVPVLVGRDTPPSRTPMARRSTMTSSRSQSAKAPGGWITA
jgi:cytochrome c